MPRNGSGSYSLPEAPFVPNTVISSAAMNSDLSDIGTALTGSLARDGQGGMTGELPLDASGFNYTNDFDTGRYRPSANVQRDKCGNIDITEISAAGLNILSGDLLLGGSPILPIGLGPLPWPAAAAPSKWLLCYGQSLLRTDYASLFVVIGTTYGSADGTHFNLPDMRGRIAPGKDDMGGTAAGRLTTAGSGVDGLTLGATGGAQNITLDTTMIPAHTHSVTDPGHDHDESGQINVQNGAGINALRGDATAPSSANKTGTRVTGITLQNTGGGLPHNNMPPAIVLNYIIYAGV